MSPVSNQPSPQPKKKVARVVVQPAAGKITFDAEGQEGGRFHSRELHVPSGSSGVTIGRGYDMSQKSAFRIKRDLMAAGVSKEDAEKLSGAHGKKENLPRTSLPRITYRILKFLRKFRPNCSGSHMTMKPMR